MKSIYYDLCTRNEYHSHRIRLYKRKKKNGERFSIRTALPRLRAAAGLRRSCSKGRRAGPRRTVRVLLQRAVEEKTKQTKTFYYLNVCPPKTENSPKLPSAPVTHIHNTSVFPNTVTLRERQNSTSVYGAQ